MELSGVCSRLPLLQCAPIAPGPGRSPRGSLLNRASLPFRGAARPAAGVTPRGYTAQLLADCNLAIREGKSASCLLRCRTCQSPANRNGVTLLLLHSLWHCLQESLDAFPRRPSRLWGLRLLRVGCAAGAAAAAPRARAQSWRPAQCLRAGAQVPVSSPCCEHCCSSF